MNTSQLPDHADVVIVGAGISGLYCAYRLLTANPSATVVVLDRLNRVGGRLDTDLVTIYDAGGHPVQVKDEEGGMRFNQSATELLALLADLGMTDQQVPFPMGDGNNLYHLRGRTFTVAEAAANGNALWSEIYNLGPAEHGKSPDDIRTAVYDFLVTSNGAEVPADPSPEFWQRFRLDFTFQGTPLKDWGLWALYRAYGLSEECIAMCADTAGFAAPFYSLVNAGEAYQILEDFPANPQFSTLSGGFGSLPATVGGRVEAMGGTIALSVCVDSIERTAVGLMVTVAGPITSATITCDRLVLALPATALQLLQAKSPALNHVGNPLADSLAADLQTVVPMRLCKVNLYYTDAWWRDGTEPSSPHVANGPSFTDLPMGAVYVFNPMVAADVDGPAPLTIYCDFTKTNFWETLQSLEPKFDSPLQRQHEQDPEIMFPASQAIVDEATRQLTEMFAMAIPQPVLTSFRLWSGEHQFGYAYHQWARHADDRSVITRMISPVENVYVCNEAFSDDQGWVNGSLRSCNLVLDNHFGIAPLPSSHPTTSPAASSPVASRSLASNVPIGASR